MAKSPYEWMYGFAPGKEPASLPFFKDLADSVYELRDEFGYAVVRQVAVVATKNDLGDYLQYVFYVFNEEAKRSWPSMPPDMRSALLIARWVMGIKVPNYSDGLKIPPPEYEKAVDKTMIELARWATTDLRKNMAKRYTQILKTYTPKNGDIATLKVDFEEALYEHTAAIFRGDWVLRLVRFFRI